jgi:uroporphyrinogen decarboxylase
LALQGNFDPLGLFSSHEQIGAEAKRILDELAVAPALEKDLHPLDGHIFNLGHGISQFTDPEHVTTLVHTVLEHSEKLRK